MSQRKILVTSALPYANGDIHLGHLVEYIQTDIWVRFQKLRGERCIYICADDTHGTAIMIAAQKEGITPEEFVQRTHKKHQEDFSAFGIEFDHYGSTNSRENQEVCDEIWAAVRKAGLVEKRDVAQLFDPVANTFLADRFVRGTCPVCGKKDQYGDNCECGAVYSPTDLIDPISVYSGTRPELRTEKHLFVEIEKVHDFLNTWVQSGALQPETANYLSGQFLSKELLAWDVSRPAPYFGFEIPDEPGNYWYVWFDAPIGYIGTTKQWCKLHGEDFDSWWRDPNTEVYHFIGKDIAYFHTLFWPVMLKEANFNLPKKVHIHGFLTVNGEKMSKSRGTFILAQTYLKHLNPSWLRYFYAQKTSNRDVDLDLDFRELEMKINADLVGNIVNIASRTAKFARETGLAESYPDDGGLFKQAADLSEEIAAAYEQKDFGKAVRLILECSYRANKFIEESAPWGLSKNWKKLAKDPDADPAEVKKAEDLLRDSVSVGLNLFRQIIIYLAPILPELKEKTEDLLNTKIEKWDDVRTPLCGSSIKEYKYMMTRIPPEEIIAMIEDSKIEEVPENNDQKGLTQAAEVPADPSSEVPAEETAPASPWNDTAEPLAAEPLAETITIDDFLKVDLRVGRILEAEQVKEARKLLKLKISLGGDQTRQVFAGIKAAYPEPEKLVGRLVVFVANLQPRQMKFGLSEGMVVASGPGGEEVFLMSPDQGAKPGQRLH
ncbi:MAG: methionine--tRNA ligase [Planctomycetia bacterium]|nr:methionine--tRNA ligase [Planctomycetia bacterium]